MDSLKNLSARDKKISLYLIGILLVIIAYVAIFSPLMDRYSALRATQKELQAEVDLLNEVNSEIDDYRIKTGKLNKEVDAFMNDFAVELKEEDVILFAKSLEDKTNVFISTVNLEQRYSVYTQGAESSESEEAATVDTTLMPETLYAVPMQIDIEGTYEQIKDSINEINKESNMKGISAISLSYDSSTGNLFGNVSMNNFFLTDSERTYSEPELDTINIGLDDLFSTVNSQTESDSEEE